MKIYLAKTNDYNCIIFAEGTEYIMRGCEPDGLFDGVVDIYADNAADQLREYFRNLDDDGGLNDFDEMPGEREEIGHEIIDILADSEIVFSGGNGIEIYSVEIAPDFNDDTFTGTFDECKKYLQDCKKDYGYDIIKNARIAKILEENGIVIETLEIFEYSEIFEDEDDE